MTDEEPDETEETVEEEEISFLPGLFLDARGHIIPVLWAERSLAVSVRRFKRLPNLAELMESMDTDAWITLYRDAGDELYIMQRSDGTNVAERAKQFTTPEANESAQFAIEFAIFSWPEWGPELRARYEGRPMISIPRVMPES